MSKATYIFIISLFFIATNICSSQTNKQKKQDLAAILKGIETQYSITFSYADSNIRDQQIIPPSKDLSLNQVIVYLGNETGLVFKKLDNNTFVIQRTGFSDITKTQYLEEVLLTNYLTQGISLKTDGTSQINLNEFGILPGLIEPDILQTIQALPGIISVDERVSNLNIRGGTNDQNLILWDGVKMYQSGHFFGLISAFNPSLIDYVTVSKNGTSAQYGDGVSGTINMQSYQDVTNNFHGGIGVNLIASDGFVKIPINKKLDLHVSARRSLTDAFKTPTYKQYFKRIFQDSDLNNHSEEGISNDERFYFYDTSAKLIYDISENDKLQISALKIYNSLDYEEFASNQNTNKSSNSELTQGSLVFNAEYTRNWSSKLQTTLQAYFSEYSLHSTNRDINNNQQLIQENKVTDGSFKAHVTYKIDNQLNYIGGYQYSEIGMGNLEDVSNPPFRRYIKDVLRSHSIFNELTFKSKSSNTQARIGLRANYIEQFSDFFLEPRLSFNQTLWDYFRIEVLAELKSQTASQIIDLQNDFLGIEKKRWVLANNSDIPIIQSKQFSTGIHFNKNMLLVSLEGYIKKVDGITTRSQGFQNQFQYTNDIGSYTVTGLDFLINKQFNQFSTWFSYSLSKNNYTFENLNNGESFPNNVDIRHQLTFAGTYTLNDFKMGVGLNWHSGKPVTTINSDQSTNSEITFNNPNSENLPNYLRADCSATYNFKLSNRFKADVGVSVWNIFNTKNTLNSYYTRTSNDELFQIENRSLGITPNITFRINF